MGEAFEYDSAQIRREAQKVKQCCDLLARAALPNADRAREVLSGQFAGAAADALDASLLSLKDDVKKLHSQLTKTYNALIRSAQELERRDAELARSFGR